MSSTWLRVATAIGRDAHLARARRILGVDVAASVGYFVLLEAELLAHHPSGILSEVETATLAEWACFPGDPELFGKALEALIDERGRLIGWDERHQVLIERMERDATRKRRERRKASKDRPKDGVKTSARNGTERHDTSRGDSSSSSPVPKDRSLNPGEKPALLLQLSTEELRDCLPEIARRFFTVFYADATPRRRHDVALQLATLAAGEPVTYRKQTVRAYDAERLDLKCLEVLEADSVDDPDRAIAYLLQMLGDTSDGSAPGAREAEKRNQTLVERPLDDNVAGLVAGLSEAWSPRARAMR